MIIEDDETTVVFRGGQAEVRLHAEEEEEGSELREWYIVIGRVHGDDEATAEVLELPRDADPFEAFKAALAEDRTDVTLLPDGESCSRCDRERCTEHTKIYKDYVFRCGFEKPVYV